MKTPEIKKKKKKNKGKKDDDFNKLNLINSFYGKDYLEIETKLNEIKKSSKIYFNEIATEYSNKCQQLINEFHTHFYKITKKIKNAFELENEEEVEVIIDEKKAALIQNYSKKYIDSFNSVLSMNEQIFENIKKNLSILLNFVDITSKSLDNENPTHVFLDKELINIINNWMFFQIHFKNYNFIPSFNKNYIDKELKVLLFNVCEKKSFYIDLTKNNNLNLNRDVYVENLKNSKDQLSYLKINDIQDVDNYFSDKVKYPSLKSLLIKNCSFSNSNYFSKFPNLEKLNINLCFNLDLKMLDHLSFNNITELYLINNGLINSDFKKIISDYLVKSDSLRKNLTILSFSDNNLSKIDFEQMVFSNKHTFHSLKEIDFRKNKIYKYKMNPEFFPSLKIINLCYNNFTSSCFKEYKNYLVQLSGNVFLMDDGLCENYYTELQKKLNMPLPSFNNLCLSYAPKSFSQNYLSNVKIGNSILFNLTYLDLSFNHMSCDTFFSFIKNNKRCLNIKRFNLSGNQIDDTFFEKYLDNDYNEMFDNLECLNLNNNLIGGSTDIDYKDDDPIKEDNKDYEKLIYKLRLIYTFIKANRNLKLLTMIRNPISKICKMIECKKEEIDKIVVKQNDKIVINCFYTFLLKIKEELICDKNQETDRKNLNIRFDCRSIINQDLCNFNFDDLIIIFKNEDI
jgi:hypothetical protein